MTISVSWQRNVYWFANSLLSLLFIYFSSLLELLLIIVALVNFLFITGVFANEECQSTVNTVKAICNKLLHGNEEDTHTSTINDAIYTLRLSHYICTMFYIYLLFASFVTAERDVVVDVLSHL